MKKSLQPTSWLLYFLLLCTAKFSSAQSYSSLVFDSRGSQFMGAYDLNFLHHGIYTLEDKLLPDSIGNAKSIYSIGYRRPKSHY